LVSAHFVTVTPLHCEAEEHVGPFPKPLQESKIPSLFVSAHFNVPDHGGVHVQVAVHVRVSGHHNQLSHSSGGVSTPSPHQPDGCSFLQSALHPSPF